MMKPAKTGNIVKVDYIGLADSKVFNTSMKKHAKEAGIYDKKNKYGPLSFRLGDRKVIEGFNDAVMGMLPGEEKTIAVTPDRAYGKYRKGLVRKYPRNLFESQGIELEPGHRISMELKSGMLKANVIEANKKHVWLDMNHEFAGKTLIFKIILKDILKK